MTSEDSIKPAEDGTSDGPWIRRPTQSVRRFLGRSFGWWASAILVLAIVALVAGLAWLWSGMRDATARLADLEEQVVRLAAEDGETDMDVTVASLVERLDAAEAALADGGAVRAGLETNLADLAGRMDRIDEGLKEAAPPVVPDRALDRPDVAGREQARVIAMLRRDVASLREMLDTLAGRSGNHAAAFVVAVGQLRDAVDSGRPFAAEHEAVAALESNDPGIEADLEALARHAGTGIATYHALAASLGDVLTAAGNVARVAAASGWIDETLAHIESLVTIRRIDGEPAGSGNQATVHRIEAAVASGNLDKALQEIDSLAPEFAGAMAQWVGKARARIEADGALERLHARAIFSVMQP